MTRDLVYEIGVEEIPASYLPPATRQFREEFETFLRDAGLIATSVETESTPRRLVLLAKGIAERQEDRTSEVLGPPWKAAFSPNGTPTKAAEGFAKGRGLTVADLRRVETERGPYVGATVEVKGRPTTDLLAEALPAITTRLTFSKTMKWGPARVRFARPIRWLLALFGSEVVPFSIEGVASGRATHGHRILARGPFDVADASAYADALAKGRVILKQSERAATIETLLGQAAARAKGTLVVDPELVEEVSYLVETPSAFESSFDEEFLQLPAPVIVTAMRDHQRYFALRSIDGALLPRFVCVANSAPESVDQVRDGNQRVLRARLDDARFYWNEDLKTTLEEKLPRLGNVVWLEGFGSLLEKTHRVRALAGDLAATFAPTDLQLHKNVDRAALLAKTDLVTEMIKDGKQFASLQGVMGREYARRGDEPSAVADAILEQYLPRFAGDALPASEAGAILAVADRLDTLVGVWASGQKPTGSKDPFGLRRGAFGILRIALARGWDYSIREWIDRAAALFESKIPDRAALADEATAFVFDRLEGLFVEEGKESDIVAAVLAARRGSPLHLQELVDAFARVRSTRRAEFDSLAAGFKRAKNILKKDSADGEPSETLLETAEEKSLYAAYVDVNRTMNATGFAPPYDEAIAALARLRAPIDAFFDSVMVLVDDPAVRANRLRLLGRIVGLIQRLGDLSRLSIAEGRAE